MQWVDPYMLAKLGEVLQHCPKVLEYIYVFV